jgi:phosphate butyryltransferase
MVEKVVSLKRKHRIAVVWAQDANTIRAITRAVSSAFTEAILIGQASKIKQICRDNGVDPKCFTISDSENEATASEEAVALISSGQADIMMKGLVGTDIFLKAILDRNKGLMIPDAVLSYVCAMEVPEYHKLLFVTDTAVIPFPSLEQKVAMAEYAIEMAMKFGIEKPKVALIGASEKASRHFESSEHYTEMCRMAKEGIIKNCIMDGPLDIFLACDKKSVEIKGVKTPVNGDADILVFPSLESCNPFYKGLMLFAGAELGGILRGTRNPVVMMSRSESEKSKFYCIALACLMV